MQGTWMVLALCLVAVAQCDQGETGQLEPDEFAKAMSGHFGHLDAHRNPRPIYGDNWLKAREYIREAFVEMGLQTELQCFNSTVTMVSTDGSTTVSTLVEGCNVVGVSGGARAGNTVVVGAHYDTQDHGGANSALARNGAGVATLLEVAKAYQDSVQDHHYYRNYTTVFVAFDLNNIEEPTADKGYSGVSNFVTGWLQPQLAQSPMRGAVILDSIATYNTEVNSQNLTSDFSQVFPEAFVRIRDEGQAKGDFLAAVTTEDGQDFLQDFVGAYRRDRMARPFRLQEMVTAGQSFGVGETFEAMTSYEAAAFWEHTPTLPALLLTDTRGMRGPPASDTCDQACTERWANPTRMEFLYHTYASLLRLLLEQQTTQHAGSGVSGAPASGLATLGCLLLGRLLYHQ